MEPAYRVVRENRDLVRVTESKAILNTNSRELDKYKQDREEKMRLKRVIEENEQMKQDLSEIKDLLRALVGQR